MESRLELLTRSIEELDCSKLMGAKAMNVEWQPTHCSNYFLGFHLIKDCPLLLAIREEFEGHTNYINQYECWNANTYGKTCNSRWGNLPNLSWGQHQGKNHNMQPPPPSSSLEEAIANLIKNMDDFVSEMRAINNKQVGDSLSEQKSIIEKDYQGFNNIEEMHEDILQEDGDTLHTLVRTKNNLYAHKKNGFVNEFIKDLV